MERQAQALAAGIIYGAISHLMLFFACVAWYGAFQPQGAPALAPAAGLFTLLAIGAAAAAVGALRSGKGRS